MKKMKQRCISFVLILLLALTAGCSAAGKVSEEIPELLDSLSEGDTYRRAERRDIGIPKVILCDAVMKAYPVFYNMSVTIGKIYVNPGDHVKAGDIIASVNSESMEKDRKNLQEGLDHILRSKAITERINAANLKEMEYEEKALREAGEIAEADAMLKNIAIKREDARFASQSYDEDAEQLRKDMSVIDETIAKGKLYADQDGVITYVADISKNATINSNIAVAVISDENDIYLEARDMDITQFNTFRNRTARVYMNGKSFEASEIEYTAEEVDLCKVNKNYPHVRFSVKGINLKAGDQLPVYMLPKISENVLCVGTDSVYTNEAEPYVYVKNGANTEKRTVKLGAKDKNYVEVTEGLEEGEEVFYQDNSEKPVKYDEYKTELSLFDVKAVSKTISGYGMGDMTYKTQYGGKVKMSVKKGDKVEKGDTLYTLTTEISNAELVEAENRVNSIVSHHNENVKEMQKREASIKDEIAKAEAARRELEELSARMKPVDSEDAPDDDSDAPDEGEADHPIYANDYMLERLNAQLEALYAESDLENEDYQTELKEAQEIRDKLRQRNSGQGDLRTAASAAGTVRFAWEYESAEPGSVLCTISGKEDDLILVMMRKTTTGATAAALKKGLKRYAMPGQTVTLESGGKTYTGKCIATNGFNMPCMVGTRNDRPYVVGFGEIAGYMFAGYEFFADFNEGNEKSDINKSIIGSIGKDDTMTFSEVRFESVISVPSAAVYEEINTKDNSKLYYVWTIEEDRLVKRYVVYDKAFDTGENVFISNGLNAGDIVAVEKVE